MIDDLLGRPTAWLGIDEPLKKTKLSEIQSRMDNISHSLVQYSGSGEHEYNSNSQRESNLHFESFQEEKYVLHYIDNLGLIWRNPT